MEENNTKRKRNSGVVSIEQRLSELAENDPYNEEIYHLLKKLAAIYINQNKWVYHYNGIEDVCHDVAADVWMNVILKGKKVGAWIYYIGKMIKLSYIPRQKKLEHEVIDARDDNELSENILYMSAGSNISCIQDFDDMQRNLILEDVEGLIYDTMCHTKFSQGSKEWLGVYTNVCINLLRDLDSEKRVYFRLDDSLKYYVDIIIEQFKKSFRNSGFTDSIMDDYMREYESSMLKEYDSTNTLDSFGRKQ